jgi:hypothetical protein
MTSGSAWARRSAPPDCNPPSMYCNYEGNSQAQTPDSCHGASCFQHVWAGQLLQCRYQQGSYQAGCWIVPHIYLSERGGVKCLSKR